MSTVNLHMVAGRLGKDPEVSVLQDGTPMAKFSVAVNPRFKKKNATENATYWFDAVAFGQQAEYIGNYFRKGMLVQFWGEHQVNVVTQQDGTKRSYHSIKVDQAVIMESKNDNQEAAAPQAAPARQAPRPAPQAAPAPANAYPEDDEDPFAGD